MNKTDLEKLGLTAEALEKAGLNADILQNIIVLHGKDIEKFKGLQPQIDELTSQLTAANTTIADLKKVDPAKLQETITKWETDFKALQAESEAKVKTIQENYALEDLLKSKYKVRDPREVLPHLTREKLVFKDGNFEGLEDQMKPLVESKSYLFNSEGSETDPSLVVTKGQSTKGLPAFDAALLKGAGLDADTKL